MSKSNSSEDQVQTSCCVVGGGPAGMMLGFLLARAGVEVLVLEKHADFFRDFRGDTIHPSTLELLYELGILDEFWKLPHQEMKQLEIQFEDASILGPVFSHLPTRCKFIAFMPQWDFLNFIADQGKKYQHFHLRMSTEVTGLIEEDGRIAGVVARTTEGSLHVHSNIVFGTDGRDSIVREKANLKVEDFGVPIDVLWFRLKKPDDPSAHYLGRVKNGRMMLTIDRGDYYQCGFIIRKGTFEGIKQQGLPAFRESIVSTVPSLRSTVEELDQWDKVKLLTVQVNRLRHWFRPGLLCIGDAAHAMSPAGGVGVNIAIQDAVATANLLASKILRGSCTTEDLACVQQRREPAVRKVQAIQVFIHRRMFESSSNRIAGIPWPMRKLMQLFAPVLRRMAARIIGMGFQPEHILTKKLD
jgi:2-polyprenyl-6-methoxyphenol hydroxylase-like FAD-dependent oxidoreductase